MIHISSRVIIFVKRDDIRAYLERFLNDFVRFFENTHDVSGFYFFSNLNINYLVNFGKE